jgi:hypothetical protein
MSKVSWEMYLMFFLNRCLQRIASLPNLVSHHGLDQRKTSRTWRSGACLGAYMVAVVGVEGLVAAH